MNIDKINIAVKKKILEEKKKGDNFPHKPLTDPLIKNRIKVPEYIKDMDKSVSILEDIKMQIEHDKIEDRMTDEIIEEKFIKDISNDYEVDEYIKNYVSDEEEFSDDEQERYSESYNKYLSKDNVDKTQMEYKMSKKERTKRVKAVLSEQTGNKFKKSLDQTKISDFSQKRKKKVEMSNNNNNDDMETEDIFELIENDTFTDKQKFISLFTLVYIDYRRYGTCTMLGDLSEKRGTERRLYEEDTSFLFTEQEEMKNSLRDKCNGKPAEILLEDIIGNGCIDFISGLSKEYRSKLVKTKRSPFFDIKLNKGNIKFLKYKGDSGTIRIHIIHKDTETDETLISYIYEYFHIIHRLHYICQNYYKDKYGDYERKKPPLDDSNIFKTENKDLIDEEYSYFIKLRSYLHEFCS